MFKRFAVIVGLLCLLVACGDSGKVTEDGTTPTLRGKDATLIAQVDCGEDGVANVHILYGQIDKSYLIGRNAITLGVGEGTETFDQRYGIDEQSRNLPFSITTSPTTGTCTTTLTDDESGKVLATKSTAGKAKLQVVLAGE